MGVSAMLWTGTAAATHPCSVDAGPCDCCHGAECPPQCFDAGSGGGSAGSSGAGAGGSAGASAGGSAGASAGGNAGASAGGAAGNGGAAGGAGSGASAGSAGTNPNGTEGDGGCDCRTAPRATGDGASAIALLVLALAWRRVRRS